MLFFVRFIVVLEYCFVDCNANFASMCHRIRQRNAAAYLYIQRTIILPLPPTVPLLKSPSNNLIKILLSFYSNYNIRFLHKGDVVTKFFILH